MFNPFCHLRDYNWLGSLKKQSFQLKQILVTAGLISFGIDDHLESV